VPIRILAVDDHELVRKGIRLLVSTESDMQLISEASTGREAVQEFRRFRPDITLMDLQMPDMSGMEAMVAIRGEFSDARVIVLTTYAGDVQVLRALKAGASGYLLKSEISTELLKTIRAIYSGRKVFSAEVSAELAEHAGEEEISARELDVLRLIAEGNANKEIAARLSLSEETVKRHVTRRAFDSRGSDCNSLISRNNSAPAHLGRLKNIGIFAGLLLDPPAIKIRRR
jgi:DNA-binding NarL/FixJ family response regulator